MKCIVRAMSMAAFSHWTKRRKVMAAVIVLALAFLAFCAGIIIDGELYDQWRPAHHLQMVSAAWVRDGCPEPPQVERYVGASSSSTTFVYTASHVINGRSYQGLCGCRFSPRLGTYAITRNGEVFVVDESGRARVLRVHKTRAAAW